MQSVYDNETVQYRLKYVLEVKHGDKSISQAATDAQVDWKTMKSWITRFEKEGITGLLNKPRGNFQPVPESVKNIIIELKKENPHRSSRRVRDLLRKNEDVSMHRQSIWRTLKRASFLFVSEKVAVLTSRIFPLKCFCCCFSSLLFPTPL